MYPCQPHTLQLVEVHGLDTVPVNEVKNYLLNLQDQISTALEAQESEALFEEDLWQRDQGGGQGRCV